MSRNTKELSISSFKKYILNVFFIFCLIIGTFQTVSIRAEETPNDDTDNSTEISSDTDENTITSDGNEGIIFKQIETSPEELLGDNSQEENELYNDILEKYENLPADDFSDAVVESQPILRGFKKNSLMRNNNIVTPSLDEFVFLSAYSGTENFNNTTGEGKDSDRDNYIVRSYDDIIYRVGYSTSVSESNQQSTSGSYYFTAELPCTSDIAVWDIEKMPWMIDANVAEENGKQILTYRVDFNGGVYAPRIGIVNFFVQVHTPDEGVTIGQPNFKMSMVDYTTDAKITAATNDIMVTAKAELDAGIKYLGVDDTGNPYFGVLVSLRHEEDGFGLKGHSFLNDSSDITIDINLPDGFNYIDIKSNNILDNGNEGIMPMEFYSKQLPFDNGGNNPVVNYDSAYKGGVVTAIQNGNVLTVTISGAQVTDLIYNPITNNASTDKDDAMYQVYDEDTYPVSAFVFQTTSTSGTNNIEVTALSHMLSDGTILADSRDDDNIAEFSRFTPTPVETIEYGYGPISVIAASNFSTNEIIDARRTDAPKILRVTGGDRISLQPVTFNESRWESDHEGINTVTQFLKINGDMLVPRPGENSVHVGSTIFIQDVQGTGVEVPLYDAARNSRVYWVAKANGTNWASESEMMDAHIDGVYNDNHLMTLDEIKNKGDFKLYATSDDILASGDVCVGIYIISNDVFQYIKDELRNKGYPDTPSTQYGITMYYYPPEFEVLDSFNTDENGDYKTLDDPSRTSVVLYDSVVVGEDGTTNKNYSQSAWVDMNTNTSGPGGASRFDSSTSYSYRKATFDSNGNMTALPVTSNHWYADNTHSDWLQNSGLAGGITLYMEQGSPYMDFAISDIEDNDKKTIYNIDAGERTVTMTAKSVVSTDSHFPHKTENIIYRFRVSPKLYPVTTTGTVQEQFNVTFGSEKKFNPEETAQWQNAVTSATWLLDSPTYSIEYDSGARDVVVNINNYPYEYELPDINVSMHIGTENQPITDVVDKEELQVFASMHTEHTNRDVSGEDYFKVSKDSYISVTKTAINPIRTPDNNEVGFDIAFKDTGFENIEVNTPFEVVDILPYNDETLGIEALNPGVELGNYKIKAFDLYGKVYPNKSGIMPSMTVYYSMAGSETLANSIQSGNGSDPYNLDSSGYWTAIVLDASRESNPFLDNDLTAKISVINNKKITGLAIKLVNAGPDSNFNMHYEYDFSNLDAVKRLTDMYIYKIKNRTHFAAGTPSFVDSYSTAETKPAPTAIVLYSDATNNAEMWTPAVKEGVLEEEYNIASPEIEGHILESETQETISGTYSETNHIDVVRYNPDITVGQQVAVYTSASPVSRTRIANGEIITYTLTAINTGVNKSESIHIEDKIPEGTEYVSGGTYANGVVSWNINGLDKNQSTSVTFKVKVKDDFDSIVYNHCEYRVGNERELRLSNTILHPTTKSPDGTSELQVVKSGSIHATYVEEGSGTKQWGYTGGTQTWTAPKTGTYTFTAWAAKGGTGDSAGDNGDKTIGSINLNEGDVVTIIVGGAGQNSKILSQGELRLGGDGHTQQGAYVPSSDAQISTVPNNAYVGYVYGRNGQGRTTTISGPWGSASGNPARATVSATPSTAYRGQKVITSGSNNGGAGYNNVEVGISLWWIDRSPAPSNPGAGGYNGGTNSTWAGGGGGGTTIKVNGTTVLESKGGQGGPVKSDLNNNSFARGAGGGTTQKGSSVYDYSATTKATDSPGSSDGYVKVSYSYRNVKETDDETKIPDHDSETVVTYSVSVANNGNATSVGTLITDEIPVGTSYVSGSASTGTVYDSDKNRIEWFIGDLPAGETRTMQFKVKLNDPVTKYLISNQADFGNGFTASQASTATPENKSNIVEYVIRGKITVNKQWSGDEDATSGRPSSITVHLLGSDSSSRTATLSANNNWQYTFTDLDFLNNVTYQVWEDAVSGYTSDATSSNRKQVPTSGFVTINNTLSAFNVLYHKAHPAASTWENHFTSDPYPDPAGPYTNGSTVTLLQNGFWNPGFKFVRWHLDSPTGDIYTPGSTLNMPSHEINLYAEWQSVLVSVPPVKYVKDENGADINEKYVTNGSVLVYNIKVTNDSQFPVEYTCYDTVPENTTYITNSSAASGGSEPDNTGKITFTHTVPAMSNYIFIFKVMANGNGKVISNVATAKVGDISADTNTVTNYTPAQPVKVSKKAGILLDNKSVKYYDDYYYEMTVENIAPVSKEFRAYDSVPVQLQILDAGMIIDGNYVQNYGNPSISGQNITWLLNIPANNNVKLYVHVRLITGDSSYSNKLQLTTIDNNAYIESNNVLNWSGQITIDSKVDTYYAPFGKPVFAYIITNGNREWYELNEINIDPTAPNYLFGSSTFYVPTGLGFGTWSVTQIDMARYNFKSSKPITNATMNGKKGATTFSSENTLGHMEFTNTIEKMNKFSHLDNITNHVNY